MRNKNQEDERMEKRSLLSWVRDLLSRNEEDLSAINSEPDEEVVERLIDKASGEPDTNAEGDGGKKGDGGDDEAGKGCPYALKRNIVASLQEVRRFAEEHNLAATMVRALLTMLAEMAIGALKGKVGENVLEVLLRAFNYTKDMEDAYIRGRNETIKREYFADSDDVPNLGGMRREEPEEPDIFTMAKEA